MPRTKRTKQSNAKPEQAKKTRTNKWTFAKLEINISQQVFEIGEAYRAKFQSKGKLRHKNSHPTQLLKLWYYLYLSCSNLMDPFDKEKHRVINTMNVDGLSWIEIQDISKGTIPIVIEKVFPIFNEFDQKMWTYLTDGGITRDLNEILKPNEWKSTKKENVSGMIKTNFIWDLRDTNKKIHKQVGVTPNILRSMRLYSVVVDYKVDADLVQQWFNWKDLRPLYYYEHLRSKRSQYEALRHSNQLTNLPVDLGKAIQGY